MAAHYIGLLEVQYVVIAGDSKSPSFFIRKCTYKHGQCKTTPSANTRTELYQTLENLLIKKAKGGEQYKLYRNRSAFYTDSYKISSVVDYHFMMVRGWGGSLNNI